MNYRTKTVISLTTEEAKIIKKIMDMIDDLFGEDVEDNCFDFLSSISLKEPTYTYTANDKFLIMYEGDTDTEDLINDFLE